MNALRVIEYLGKAQIKRENLKKKHRNGEAEKSQPVKQS